MNGKGKNINRIAIANRGEVAVRIIRACQDLGIETVLLHSEVDTSSLAYRLCDKAVCIGAATTAESYLNIEANINGALATGAQAIHPGFGFLSENEEFAAKCAESGIVFIGPKPESIGLLGDKIRAKNLVVEAEVPTVPGYQGEDQSVSFLREKCEEIGYPVIAKAAAGGGGRGMKIVRSSGEAEKQIEAAKREALSAFGSETVFLEKYLDGAKHIEVQVFGDAFGKIHCLHERECSVQRRHQKIIEEAVAVTLTDSLRLELHAAAVSVAKSAKYVGAGTVEFLVQDGQFYFLEMNTRLQVEHPVTEMVLGIDLVVAQILTAQGCEVEWPERFTPRGHSIECRIYSEDPYQQGIPSTGELGSIVWPEGPGRRFEVGFEKGDVITAYYDSMIAKVIVWAENRELAIQKMQRTLKDCVVFGLKSNIPFLQEILAHPEFQDATMTTRFIDKYFSEGLSKPEKTPLQEKVSSYLVKEASRLQNLSQKSEASLADPWSSL